jgi:hypothetical protein
LEGYFGAATVFRSPDMGLAPFLWLQFSNYTVNLEYPTLIMFPKKNSRNQGNFVQRLADNSLNFWDHELFHSQFNR